MIKYTMNKHSANKFISGDQLISKEPVVRLKKEVVLKGKKDTKFIVDNNKYTPVRTIAFFNVLFLNRK